MSRSNNIRMGMTVRITLINNAALQVSGVVAGVDDSGIYLDGSEPESGVMFPWSNIARVNY
jgi:hypothetical protein